jgi:acyl carrier protein
MAEVPAEVILSDSNLLAHLRMLAGTELELEADQIDRIELDTPIVEGLQLDSLKQVVLIANLEDTYGFELAPQDFDQLQSLKTVGDLVRMIQQHSSAKSKCS